MKRSVFIALTCICIGISMAAAAQKPYFVYLQSDNNQPFFVLLNKKNYSSSSVGHVIIPGLTNGNYTFQIGFAGQNPSQEYNVEIKDADQGYVIKSFDGGKSYGILNLQTADVQMSGASKKAAEEAERQKALAAEAARAEEQRKAEALAAEQARALQKAKEDSITAAQQTAAAAVVAAPVVERPNDVPPAEVKTETKKEVVAEKQAEPVKQEVNTRSSAGVVEQGVPPVAAGAAVAAGSLSAAEIARLQEEARRIDAQGKRDSVLKAQKQTNPPAAAAAPVFLDMDFSMPADSLAREKHDSVKVAEQTVVSPTPAMATAAPAKDTLTVAPVAVQATPLVSDSGKAGTAVPAKNPNCVNEATDADIELVGMLIKSEKDVEESLELARKTMKLKCATTAQVRKLALLFDNQEDRYRLLDAAFKYTSDRQQYGSLSDLLTDPYYLNRFKAMLQ